MDQQSERGPDPEDFSQSVPSDANDVDWNIQCQKVDASMTGLESLAAAADNAHFLQRYRGDQR